MRRILFVALALVASVFTVPASAHHVAESGSNTNQQQQPPPEGDGDARIASASADGGVETMSLAATSSFKVLVYGPTSGGYTNTTPGAEITVWDRTTWASKTTADFAQFDAIAFGDRPVCFSEPSIWDTAVANRQVWSAAITGNVIINGTDPDFHGKTQFVHQSVQFAAADLDPGPGLYVSLSCAYHYGSHTGPEPVELLGVLGRFVVRSVNNCPNDVHKVSDHAALAGLTDAYLSNWGCSTHEVFDSWPGNFQPLAIVEDAAPTAPYVPYFAPDGSTGLVYILASGASTACAASGDTDGDCLPDTVEAGLGTNPNDPDTDDDELLDSWEVKGVPGAGIRLPSGRIIDRDLVFGPYANGRNSECRQTSDDEKKLPTPFKCYNHRPNPLHKNVYVEMDWQDCNTDYACPEILTVNVDPLHHAPNPDGIRDVTDMFRNAPVSNPDGTNGIVLSVLIDEKIPHEPNCDQDSAFSRVDSFGNREQRADEGVMEAKAMAVRYAWSGHSTTKNNFENCANPGMFDFLKQGVGLAPLAEYDYTPFGDVNVDGKDILVSLSVMWACHSEIGDRMGYVGPCFRETEIAPRGGIGGGGGIILPDPGIFPGKIKKPGGGTITVNHPIHRLLGQKENDATRQLWGRGFAHLLGHSLGLHLEGSVNNKPAPAGRHQSDDKAPLTPLKPDSYSVWAGLSYAPGNGEFTMAEGDPNYEELARTSLTLSDPDNDEVMEHDDNCPGVHNPDQDNSDAGSWWVVAFGGGSNIAEFGDACDPDIDGDGKRNPAPGEGERFALFAAADVGAVEVDETDAFPYDTNDDGEDNAIDDDDDGDGVLDTADNCAIHFNADQVDVDGDGLGDACD